MAISKFKVACLGVVAEVNRTGEPVLLTRFGHPLAEVVPARGVKPLGWVGSMKNTGKILGDVIAPALDPEEWNAPLREWDELNR